MNSGGITTSSPIEIKYNSDYHILLANRVSFNSVGINTVKNTITIPSHNFYTGQKVFYDTENYLSNGISTGIYFVNKVDSNTIKLCESYADSISFPPQELNILNSGGSNQELSLVKPKITVIKNNNLIFDLSDFVLNHH